MIELPFGFGTAWKNPIVLVRWNNNSSAALGG
jgi:hypothetical protein